MGPVLEEEGEREGVHEEGLEARHVKVESDGRKEEADHEDARDV
jgi:hypothetical protein